LSTYDALFQTAIKAGEEVTNQYSRSLQPTHLRRPFLREKWYFDCGCRRCRDPTELGSHLGSLTCPRPRCGAPLLPARPLLPSGPWACRVCGAALTHPEVTALLRAAGQLIAERLPGEDTVEHHERVIHALAPALHPHHHLLLELKAELASLYGRPPLGWAALPRPAKERKVQVCHEVLAVLGRIEGTFSAERARVLGELTRARVLLAREDHGAGRITARSMQAVLIQAKGVMLVMAAQNKQMLGQCS
jgi:hypothetical protein